MKFVIRIVEEQIIAFRINLDMPNPGLDMDFLGMGFCDRSVSQLIIEQL